MKTLQTVVSDDVVKKIEKDSKETGDSVSSIIAFILKLYYRGKK